MTFSRNLRKKNLINWKILNSGEKLETERRKKNQSFVYEELFKIERIICGRIRRKKVNV
jgi:hypothetical protein